MAQQKMDESTTHTKEKIFAKLDTDLTDAERKSYIKVLLQSPQTVHLLKVVSLDWKIKLLQQQIDIETKKEKIRWGEEWIENISCLNKESVQKSTKEHKITLQQLESSFEINEARAVKSFGLIAVLDESMQMLKAIESAKNNSAHN